jgi:hypothetical protein
LNNDGAKIFQGILDQWQLKLIVIQKEKLKIMVV